MQANKATQFNSAESGKQEEDKKSPISAAELKRFLKVKEQEFFRE
ncbi:MAG TPA: hypothetical protein V6C85_14750 [Allocoleopsis sp.]